TEMKQEVHLDISSTLFTAQGIMKVAKAISERSEAASLRFQIEGNAGYLKEEILDMLGLTEFVQSEVREEYQPRTTPLVFENHTIFNQGCELL
ncbi:hypothetical protein PMAYCL1PPCAC_15101, partial [Pristionchus mayeri]